MYLLMLTDVSYITAGEGPIDTIDLTCQNMLPFYCLVLRYIFILILKYPSVYSIAILNMKYFIKINTRTLLESS